MMFDSSYTRLLCLSLLALATCDPEGTERTSVAALAPEPQSAKDEPLDPYPPARWRLDTSRIGDVVLWVSQILIRHAQASVQHPCFSLADWNSAPPLPSRSRTDALALARALAEQAQNSPGRFAELARQHSEDICTRDGGGSFGGITASQFQPWPEVLDALAATPPGSVSRVVETRYGFHVFHRRAPPPDEVVSGARIVIAHDDAGWIKVVARGEVGSRSRADALALANEIQAQAAANPGEFSRLVDRHSEHRDALRAGDIGTWSTREPTDLPREVELLARLRVGEVAPPMDSPVGFEILQRTANRPRQTYAMEHVRLDFTPGLPAARPASEASVLATARSMGDEARRSPSALAQLQSQHCCFGQEQWVDGRGSPALSSALDQLAVGELAKEPVRSENSYVIVRRVAPTAAPRSTLYELPAPAAPNIAYLLTQGGAGLARTELAPVAREATSLLRLEGEAAKTFARLHETGDLFDDQSAQPATQAAYEALQRQVSELLGPERYNQYLGLLNARFERLLLGAL